MTEFALHRVLTRARRRKPRPPWWWMAVGFLALFTVLAVECAAVGNWLSLGANACNIVIQWRALHNPPTYHWDARSFLVWWPTALLLSIGGLFW